MAKKHRNYVFLIIYAPYEEVVAVEQDHALCHCCGDVLVEGGYYCPIPDVWFCKTCYRAYNRTARHYKSDIDVERANYTEKKRWFELAGLWQN